MRPSRYIIWILLLLLAVYSTAVALEAGISWFYAVCGVLSLILVVDFVAGRVKKPPTISRRCYHSVPLGVWTKVELRIKSNDRFTTLVDVFDLCPSDFRLRGLPQTIELPPGKQTIIHYEINPRTRGDYDFTGCQVRINSPFSLWQKTGTLNLTQSVSVLPNFSPVTKFAMMGMEHQFNSIGIRNVQRRGEGMEFHQLRNYRIGDTFRQIDWKATARAGKFITKEYRDEQNQQVVFMLDTGRRMLTEEAEYSHFDHVLNAMLLLAYVAIREGDSVGFSTFGASPLWVPPRKGNNAINTLLSQVYRLQPSPVATDYRSAAQQLIVRQKRRALVVIMTNVRDEDDEDLKAALMLLRRHHLVLLASIREEQLDGVLKEPVGDMDDAVMYAATSQYLDQRKKALGNLQTAGVIIQDSLWNTLAPDITSRYLAIKKAGML